MSDFLFAAGFAYIIFVFMVLTFTWFEAIKRYDVQTSFDVFMVTIQLILYSAIWPAFFTALGVKLIKASFFNYEV